MVASLSMLSLLAAAQLDQPEQVHLALSYTPDRMAVQWAGAVGANSSTLCATAGLVHYGTSTSSLTSVAKADCTAFDLGSDANQLTQANYNATLTGLAPGTKYYYSVSIAGATSAVFQFHAAPDASTLDSQLPHQFIVYGDLGSSMSMPSGSSTCMPFGALPSLKAGASPTVPEAGSSLLRQPTPRPTSERAALDCRCNSGSRCARGDPERPTPRRRRRHAAPCRRPRVRLLVRGRRRRPRIHERYPELLRLQCAGPARAFAPLASLAPPTGRLGVVSAPPAG
jgi:hypothetical protein